MTQLVMVVLLMLIIRVVGGGAAEVRKPAVNDESTRERKTTQ